MKWAILFPGSHRLIGAFFGGAVNALPSAAGALPGLPVQAQALVIFDPFSKVVDSCTHIVGSLIILLWIKIRFTHQASFGGLEVIQELLLPLV